MAPPIAFVLPLVLVVFWAWMFSDMAQNDDLTPDERTTWMWLFIILNIGTAIYYFATVYRHRR
ncbi:MAG TPA: hypothetical protein VNZ58_09115 [Thermomicrobiales bacterium]|nr:hypothetical protein [Thermomicrobiales bacterium]